MVSNVDTKKISTGGQNLPDDELAQHLTQVLQQWEHDYDLNTDDCEKVRQKFWAEELRSSAARLDVLDRLHNIFKKRQAAVLGYKTEICAFIRQFHRLDGEFAQHLAQQRTELQDKYDLKSDRFTNPTLAVDRYQDALDRYTKAVHDLAQKKQSLAFNEADRIDFDKECQDLGLEATVAKRIEQDLLEQKRREYHHKLTNHIAKTGQLPSPEFCKALLVAYWLDEALVQDIHASIASPDPLPSPLPVNELPLPPTTISSPTIPWKLVFGVLTSVGVVAVAIVTFRSSQFSASYQEVTDSTLDQMPISLQPLLPPIPLSGAMTIQAGTHPKGSVKLPSNAKPPAPANNPTPVDDSVPVYTPPVYNPAPVYTPPRGDNPPPERTLPSMPDCDSNGSLCPPAHTP